MKIQNDKLLHALVCAGATIGSFLYMRIFSAFPSALAASWLLPAGLGLGKEYGDSKATGNRWDWWDILADAIGILSAIAVILAFRGITGD